MDKRCSSSHYSVVHKVAVQSGAVQVSGDGQSKLAAPAPPFWPQWAAGGSSCDLYSTVLYKTEL